MSKLHYLLILIAFAATTACSKNEDNTDVTNAYSLLSGLEELGNANLFIEALETTGLTKEFSNESSTVFIPNDSVFQQFIFDNNCESIAELESLLDSVLLRQLVASHFLLSPIRLEQVTSSYIKTRALNSINENISAYLSRNEDALEINQVQIITEKSNFELGSNTFHYVNDIIKPATLKVLINANSSEFSVLSNAIDLSDNTSILLNDPKQELTFFGPTDLAFEGFFNSYGVVNLQDIIDQFGQQIFDDQILCHIVRGNHLLSPLSTASLNTLLSNHFINIEVNNGVIEITDNQGFSASILINDIQALNGNLNLIDKVLNLP